MTPDDVDTVPVLVPSFLAVELVPLAVLLLVVALARVLLRRCDCLVFDAGGSFGGASFLGGVACSSS